MEHRKPLFYRRNCLGSFTLNELLVSVAIIGVLAAISAPVVNDALLKTKIASTQYTLRVISDGVELFAVDRGYYPFGSSQPPSQFITNYDAQSALQPLIGSYLPDDIGILRDPFTESAAQSINDSIAIDLPGLPDVFGFSYYDYSHFMVPPQNPVHGYGIVSFGPDGIDSSLGLRPLPGIGSLISDAFYQPSNGLRSGGDLGRFGGNISLPQ